MKLLLNNKELEDLDCFIEIFSDFYVDEKKISCFETIKELIQPFPVLMSDSLLYLSYFIHSDQLRFRSLDLFRPAWSYFTIFRIF